MGFESDTLLTIKYNLKNVEISPPESNCDNKSVITLEKIFKPIVTINNNVVNFDLDLNLITSLNLSHCNLEDLPPKCSVPNLKQLNLSHNQFNRVPKCLYSDLKNLEQLDLSYNKISNFDRELDCITKLTIVNLNNNNFDNIPKWFLTFRCPNMLEFDYSRNKSKHYNFLKNSFCCAVNKLTKLQLRNCLMIDSDYSFLRQFKHLRYLDIGNNEETYANDFVDLDKLFVNLKWRDLLILKVNGLGIAMFPKGILWIESLVELHFNNNRVSWLPDDIKYMINLQVLEVSENNLVSLPENLIDLKELRIIKADHNAIEQTPNFRLFENLEVLDLYHNKLEEISFAITETLFVDIELNFFDTKDLNYYSEYTKRKEKYRKIISNGRFDGYRLCRSDEEDSKSSCSEEDLFHEKTEEFTSKESITSEDWDQEIYLCEKKMRSFNVESDDDWTGEEQVNKKGCETDTPEKIYVPDEDWMFEDADEDIY